MASPAENIQSKIAKGDQTYALSTLPQEDDFDSDISSFSTEMRSSTHADESRAEEDGYPRTFPPPEPHFAGEFSSEFCSSEDNETACAISNFTVFTIFYLRLAANREADFTFGCENCDYNLTSGTDHRTGIHHDYTKGYIFYSDGHENVLSTVSIEPYNLGAKEHERLHVKFGNTGWEGNQPIVRKEAADEIGKQIEHGKLHLGIRLDLWVTYKKWGSFWEVVHWNDRIHIVGIYWLVRCLKQA